MYAHTLVHSHTLTHTPVVGSIDIHLIQRLLITVPAQGEYFQRYWSGYWHNNRLVLWRTEPMDSLLFFLLWPQVNKLTGPPGEQALAPWRQHWYAIWWIYSNYCCHARPAVWPRLQGSEGWGEIFNISAGGGVRGGGAGQSVSNIEAPQVTLLQYVRSSEQRETKATWSCGHSSGQQQGEKLIWNQIQALLNPHHVTPSGQVTLTLVTWFPHCPALSNLSKKRRQICTNPLRSVMEDFFLTPSLFSVGHAVHHDVRRHKGPRSRWRGAKLSATEQQNSKSREQGSHQGN